MKKVKAESKASIQKQIEKLKKLKNVEGLAQSASDEADRQISKLQQKLDSVDESGDKPSSKKKHRKPFFKEGDTIQKGKKEITVISVGAWDDEENAYRMIGTHDFLGYDKELKKMGKKKSGLSDDEISGKLKDCKEIIAANRKPRKEPVHHTKETRLTGALNTIVNICLEGNEDDPATIEKIKAAVKQFEIKLKRDFLGLKLVKPSKKIVDKLDDAAAKATA